MTSLIVKTPKLLKSQRNWLDFDDFENLFDRFFNSYPQYAGEEGMINMPVELLERDNNLIMKVMIPGMKKEDINIEVSEDQVNITGECKTDYEEDKDLIHRSEFCIGRFSRSLSLPQKINNQKAKAEYKDGILILTLPKSEQEKNKIVKISF